MRYRVSTDPFHKKGPVATFVSELIEPYHTERPTGFGERAAEEGELSLFSVSLAPEFPDPEGLLETAYDDLRAFFCCVGIEISDSGTPMFTRFCNTPCREAYNIGVYSDKVVISAADTEGIRRAIYYIQDEMKRRCGAFLPLGELSRTPFVKSRISRCFFSPPSHASNEGAVNELASDIDYYPDEYLNRLAHDGINGLWLGASLHDILKSKVIPEYGEDSKRRIAKLRSVVSRCRRYGIGVYLLSVEPASGYENPAFEKHTEFHGQRGWSDYHLFCPSTEGCMEYIRSSMRELFTRVPALAGFINISTGECLSGCGSAMKLTCPACRKKYGTLARTLAATEKAFSEAIKEVAPEAEFISWTYSQRAWERSDVIEACEKRDPSVIHMQNFEDFGRVEQMGKERIALDYWLSYVGPGEIMEDSLKVNKRRGVTTWAKLQVCSSHEISTVPYVPVPGILYDKYDIMRREGISGAVMCWYFGNYPCMMNKAACELSFEPFPRSKEQFLKDLAGIYWGSDAGQAARAYSLFEEGYKNYPVSQSFEWFGPMQDSPVAPLHLIPVDLPMPSTWLTENMVGGDRIGECLTDGHTLGEALTLADRMSEIWRAGTKSMSDIADSGEHSRKEQKRVAEAIDILFSSGRNVLRFYELRHRLGIGDGDARALLSELRGIVEDELEASRRLIGLCEKDARLGYHPEAHGYKFFPEKLGWRMGELEALLDGEFIEVEKRLAEGLAPIGFYAGEGDGRTVRSGEEIYFYPDGSFRYNDGKAGTPWEASASSGCMPELCCQYAEDYFSQPKTKLLYTEENGRIKITLTLLDGTEDSIHIKPEFHLFHPSAHIDLCGGELVIEEQRNFSLIGSRLMERRRAFRCDYYERASEDISGLLGDTAVYEISFDRCELGMTENEPFRMDIARSGKHNELLELADRKYTRLIQGTYSPDSFALFLK